MKGFFVSFEGIDGSGKSTQSRCLYDTLSAQGFDVLLTREPGGSPGAEEIRSLLLGGREDRWSPETELLLFMAARLDHVQRVVRPALEQGKIVVCDRFIDSTRVYQGLARARLDHQVEALHDLMIAQEPDLTFLIDISAEDGLRRTLVRANRIKEQRFEEMGVTFLNRVRQGFLDLATRSAGRIVVIDGSGHQDIIATQIYDMFSRHSKNVR